MRALLVATLALSLGLVGSFAPLGGSDAPLEPASLAPAAALPRAPAPACVLDAPEVRATPTYAQLRWTPCGDAGYEVLRGETPDTLAPLVEVAHPGHVDVDVTPGAVYYYAIAQPGARSPVVVAAIPAR
jgi:hypothetical protein